MKIPKILTYLYKDRQKALKMIEAAAIEAGKFTKFTNKGRLFFYLSTHIPNEFKENKLSEIPLLRGVRLHNHTNYFFDQETGELKNEAGDTLKSNYTLKGSNFINVLCALIESGQISQVRKVVFDKLQGEIYFNDNTKYFFSNINRPAACWLPPSVRIDIDRPTIKLLKELV